MNRIALVAGPLFGILVWLTFDPSIIGVSDMSRPGAIVTPELIKQLDDETQ